MMEEQQTKSQLVTIWLNVKGKIFICISKDETRGQQEYDKRVWVKKGSECWGLIIVIMPERKVWSGEEDKILKLLRQERGEKKWATIARLMEAQFGIVGRTGKQCRERYHNHLDSGIVSTQWTPQEEQLLYQMHEDIGNKWSTISQKLPGRSDNCVKNHFYSKLRKSVRRLNRLITDCFPQQRLIKESVLARIIKTTDSKFKNSSKIDEELAEFCNTIKNRLFSFGLGEEDSPQELQAATKLIEDIQHFDRDFKKGYKGLKAPYKEEYSSYLKPPSAQLKKRSSSQSWSSDRSDDSFLSSSSFFSSNDLSDCDPDLQEFQKKSKSTGSGTLSHRNSNEQTLKGGETHLKSKSCKTSFISKPKTQNPSDEEIEMKAQKEQFCGQLKIESFAREYQDLIEGQDDLYNQSRGEIHYNNMIYDDTPMIARILCPHDSSSSPHFFGKEGDNEEELQFKLDKMEL